MKPKNILLIGAVLAMTAITALPTPAQAQTSNPLLGFLNPTNTFLEAQELNLTLDAGYQRNRHFSTGLGARWWVSDSQGAAVTYTAFPSDDKGEWQIAYGYRTAYQQVEIDFFAGMAEDVDQSLLFRPYLEVDVIYQATKTLGIGAKLQITESERPFAGVIATWKLGKKRVDQITWLNGKKETRLVYR